MNCRCRLGRNDAYGEYEALNGKYEGYRVKLIEGRAKYSGFALSIEDFVFTVEKGDHHEYINTYDEEAEWVAAREHTKEEILALIDAINLKASAGALLAGIGLK